MRTARLPTVLVSVTITRCQYHGAGPPASKLEQVSSDDRKMPLAGVGYSRCDVVGWWGHRCPGPMSRPRDPSHDAYDVTYTHCVFPAQFLCFIIMAPQSYLCSYRRLIQIWNLAGNSQISWHTVHWKVFFKRCMCWSDNYYKKSTYHLCFS